MYKEDFSIKRGPIVSFAHKLAIPFKVIGGASNARRFFRYYLLIILIGALLLSTPLAISEQY